MYYEKKKYLNQSINKKIWDIIKNESVKLERRYKSITKNNNGKLIFELTHVAKLFNTYFYRDSRMSTV